MKLSVHKSYGYPMSAPHASDLLPETIIYNFEVNGIHNPTLLTVFQAIADAINLKEPPGPTVEQFLDQPQEEKACDVCGCKLVNVKWDVENAHRDPDGKWRHDEYQFCVVAQKAEIEKLNQQVKALAYLINKWVK